MLGLILVYIFAGRVCLAIDYHPLLLHLCHSAAFAAEQLYLRFYRGCLIMSFESITVTSEILGDALYSLIWVFGGKGMTLHQ